MSDANTDGWKQRLDWYRDGMLMLQHLRQDVESERSIRYSVYEDMRSRYSHVIPRDRLKESVDRLDQFVNSDLPKLDKYAQSEQYFDDLKWERLEYLQLEESHYRLQISEETSRRAFCYLNDYGWQTGSIILAINKDALDELNELRAWRDRKAKAI